MDDAVAWGAMEETSIAPNWNTAVLQAMDGPSLCSF
jgi:hypothetical protein